MRGQAGVKKTATISWAALATSVALAAAGCEADTTDPTGSTPEQPVAADLAAESPVASGEMWGGVTTVLDPATATPVLEGGGVTTSQLTSWEISGDTVDPIAFIGPGEFSAIAYPADTVDGNGIVKRQEFGWFDGAFHTYGDTSQAVNGDGPRWVFRSTTEEARAAWFESADLDNRGNPWRLFTATRESAPLLLATSEQLAGRELDVPRYSAPALWEGRVYWSSPAPAGAPGEIATWSVPLDGSEGPRLDGVGATDPAATSTGIVVMAAQPDAADATDWSGNQRRVMPLGGPTADPLLSLHLREGGAEPGVDTAGEWVLVVFDAPGGGSEVLVGNRVTHDGFAVPLGPGVEHVRARVCDEAVVWTGSGEDWKSVGIYRLDLDTGEISWLGTPTLMALHDCSGDDVLWTSRDGSVATTWVTNWS